MTVVLCNIRDVNSVVEEERYNWTIDVLGRLGVTEDVIAYKDKDIDQFKYFMDKIGIEVELVSGGLVNIYKKKWYKGVTESMSGWLPPTKEHLVAQWNPPTYNRKSDETGSFYELILNIWEK